MIKISATQLRKNLFELLTKVSQGEVIVIHRHQQEIARLVAPQRPDWRQQMTAQPKFLTKTDELIKPLPDIWEEYT